MDKKITRVEIIDPRGRQFVHYGEVKIQFQDGGKVGKTLKCFLSSNAAPEFTNYEGEPKPKTNCPTGGSWLITSLIMLIEKDSMKMDIVKLAESEGIEPLSLSRYCSFQDCARSQPQHSPYVADGIGIAPM